MILIIGSEGSMGKRYQAILKHLGESFMCYDLLTEDFLGDLIQKSTGVIIATPTETHLPYLKLLKDYNYPILCEKPLSKDKNELDEIRRIMGDKKFSMMIQYAYLPGVMIRSGDSYYNYFRHGSDGLAWDCIQIIGLAKGFVNLGEESPIWQCRLNGTSMPLERMDQAYVMAVKAWLNEEYHEMDYLMELHNKVFDYIEKH